MHQLIKIEIISDYEDLAKRAWRFGGGADCAAGLLTNYMITVDADGEPLSEEAFVARKAKISKVVTTYFSMGCPKDNKLGAIIRTLRSDAMRRMHSERTATQVGASNAKRERTVSRLPIAVQIRMAGALLNISTKKRRQDERESRKRLPTKSLEEVLKLTNETI